MSDSAAKDEKALRIEILTTLLDEGALETRELKKCGHAYTHLRQITASLQSRSDNADKQETSYRDLCLSLSTLWDLAKEQIDSVPFGSVGREWFRLYTDVALLWALIDLQHDPGPACSKYASLECVRRLDMAIIVAGAVGHKRLKWVNGLISVVQRKNLQSTARERSLHPRTASPNSGRAIPDNEPPLKRRRITPDKLDLAPNHITRFETPPSVKDYVASLRHEPFILSRYLNSPESPCAWSALAKWGDRDFLKTAVGPGRVVPVEVGSAYTDASFGQHIMMFSDFLERIFEPRGGEPPLYLAQHTLLRQFPQLANDIVMPEFVHTAAAIRSTDASEYHSPATDDGLLVNVWIGGGRGLVTSPAHTDPYYNCYAQVLGTKRVWLAPPGCTPDMHHNESGSSSDTIKQYLTNTSPHPILRQPREEWLQGPAAASFRDRVLPKSLEAVLHPGDLLVMPPGWWHAMRGEGQGPGWSVSIWY